MSSFHPSGHKPTIVKRAPAGFKEQLPVIGFGALLIIGGVYRQMHGVLVQPNWYFQPIYSSGMIVAGSVIVLIGLIPIPWIDQFVKARVSRPTHPQRDLSDTNSPSA